MIGKLNFAIVAIFAATGALAQTGCLSSADLQAGIHVDYADGTTETYVRTGPGLMSVDGFDGGELYFQLELAHGTHLLSYVAVSGGQPDESTRQTYDYGVAPAELPVPVAGQRFNADVTVTASDGPRQEGQLQAYVEGVPLVIDGCTYETLDVIIAYDTADNYMENIRYLPQLGLGYLLWNQTDEGKSDDNIVTGMRSGK